MPRRIRLLPVAPDKAMVPAAAHGDDAINQIMRLIRSCHYAAMEHNYAACGSTMQARFVEFEHGTIGFRTLFISDVHLGARGCQADRLLDFLRYHDAHTIYLVGDIVDGWQLRSGWYWPQQHNDVVQKLLRKARKGTRVIYLPGNHDEFLRDYYGTHFGGIEVMETAIHQAADGRRYLVVHGDMFDLVVKHARWLALLGDTAYDFALLVNRYFNAIRRRLGFSYWSLSQWAKHKVKNAVNYIGAFEQTLAAEAQRHQVDGVICGHIHHAVIHDRFGIRYINCGDWVESCTAVAEHADGRFEIITWTQERGAGNPLEQASGAQIEDQTGMAA
jgi:UDP-2,3-diacylglucosamine pyrophosphatase LpxH